MTTQSIDPSLLIQSLKLVMGDRRTGSYWVTRDLYYLLSQKSKMLKLTYLHDRLKISIVMDQQEIIIQSRLPCSSSSWVLTNLTRSIAKNHNPNRGISQQHEYSALLCDQNQVQIEFVPQDLTGSSSSSIALIPAPPNGLDLPESSGLSIAAPQWKAPHPD